MQTTPLLHEEEVAYRQVSPIAVIALALGVCSLVAFVGPEFLPVPLAAIGAALLALGKIRRSDGALTGEGLARLAIALALAFAAGALVRESVRDTLMQRQAADTARQWLDLLAKGRTKDARELLSPDGSASLLPRREMGQEPLGKDEGEAIILDALRSDALTRTLAEPGREVTLDSAASPVFEGGRAVIGVSFSVGAAGKGDHRHLTLQLNRTATFERDGRPWRVDRWLFEPPHASHE